MTDIIDAGLDRYLCCSVNICTCGAQAINISLKCYPPLK